MINYSEQERFQYEFVISHRTPKLHVCLDGIEETAFKQLGREIPEVMGVVFASCTGIGKQLHITRDDWKIGVSVVALVSVKYMTDNFCTMLLIFLGMV